MQMYFGGLYQYALSLLTVQIETSTSGKENQLSVAAVATVFAPPFSVSLHRLGWHPAPGESVPYFIEAARLLHLLSLAFEDKELNVPVPDIDLRKNTALAMMKTAYIVDSLPRLHVQTFMDEAVREQCSRDHRACLVVDSVFAAETGDFYVHSRRTEE
jgi:hypothetical protein